DPAVAFQRDHDQRLAHLGCHPAGCTHSRDEHPHVSGRGRRPGRRAVPAQHRWRAERLVPGLRPVERVPSGIHCGDRHGPPIPSSNLHQPRFFAERLHRHEGLRGLSGRLTMTSPVRQAAEQASNVVAGTTLGVTFLGITVQDWASILAAVWLIWQLGWSAYSKYKESKDPLTKE